MIDYEKLKLAHELCEKLLNEENETMTICICHMYGKHRYILTDGRLMQWAFMNIDDLIAKLQELTKPEPKYKDAWYLLENGDIRCTTVLEGDGYAMCEHTDPCAAGKIMFHTRQSLIEAQLQYWSKLYEQENPGDLCLIKRSSHNESMPSDGYPEKKCEDCGHVIYGGYQCPCVHLKSEEPQVNIDECQHESGQTSPIIRCDGDIERPFECTKCGEFYR